MKTIPTQEALKRLEAFIYTPKCKEAYDVLVSAVEERDALRASNASLKAELAAARPLLAAVEEANQGVLEILVMDGAAIAYRQAKERSDA